MDLLMRDTIAACATAPGAAGIAIVRVSGPLAEPILTRVFTSRASVERLEHARLYLGTLHDGDQPIDECMAVIMRAPKSYTRQDVAELQLHGSAYSVSACLNALTRAGARPAEPGEFTLRAYLNGRIDLSQAESVMALIQANNERAGQSALRQLNGGASRFIGEAQETLLTILARVEAAIDYPEEVDDPAEDAALAEDCRGLAAKLDAAAQERAATLVRDGLHVALLGPPNAGKSTLLNALLGEDKAIVTDIPGTTRDVLSGAFTLDGYAVTLYDTAGIHETADQIERLGIDRTFKTAASADAVWWLSDISAPEEPPEAVLEAGLPLLKVYTKADCLPSDASAPRDGIAVSAVTGQGLDALRDWLKGLFARLPDTPLTQQRHILAARGAAQSLREAAGALDSHLSQEFAAVHLHAALDTLGGITGARTDERLLNEIFSNFCVGK